MVSVDGRDVRQLMGGDCFGEVALTIADIVTE
jgi:hypothetical protein